jgi:hypothetical protein
MSEKIPQPCIRERLKDLDTKAYYLLVALSFIYARAVGTRTIKWAFVLTLAAGIVPVQDYVHSKTLLEVIRALKILTLIAALAFTLCWIWRTSN